MTAKPHVRRDPRATALRLEARYRGAGDDVWHMGRLYDLSVGGALVRCGNVTVGQKISLLLERPEDGVRIEVAAEVTRVIQRADRAAVRFLELSAKASSSIAALLNAALDGSPAAADDDDDDDDEPLDQGRTGFAALRLHDVSLYDLLELDPACPNGELESACEAFIKSVADDLKSAVGKREARLRVLLQSLERMRPLWNDPVKRARYDLRWGYMRVDERLADSESGAGVHAHILMGIWFDLYPELVREAERVMARARIDGVVPCLKKAIELDPFCRRRRQRLAWIESPPEPDADGPAMPPPGEAPMVRGSLADLPLRTLLRSVAEDEEDAEIVVRAGGKAVGVVGITRGDVVTAIAGEHRGVAAVRALAAVRDGTFQARYSAPRVHLRHMREPALQLLDEAQV